MRSWIVAPPVLRVTVSHASLAYVALPVGLFLARWLRPTWAALIVPLLLLGVMAWGHRLRAARNMPLPAERPVSAGALLGSALMVVAALALLGSGGVGIQTWDWAKHNAVLKDLINQPWPVAYATGRDDVALIYYIAYYLPAALVGKVAGWTAANVTLFAWSALGAVLALLWLVILTGGSVWRCLAIFLLFSGLDLVGAATWSSRSTSVGWTNDFNAEWWAEHWTYPSNVTLLAYAPHQTLGAWLLTGLALDGLRRDPGRTPYLLGGALGLLWSPFAVIGLLGLALLDWATAWRRRGGLSGLARDPAEGAGGLTGLVLIAYFVSRRWPLTLPARYYPPPDRIADSALTFLPARLGWGPFAADYAAFVVLEFLLLAGLLAAVHRGCRHELRLLGVATATLLTLPFFRYGHFNDLAMRASIPALFILQVLAVRAADAASGRPLLTWAVMAVLGLGATYPANMLRMSAAAVVRRRALVEILPQSEVRDLFQQQLALHGQYFFVGQYVGALDAPFFRLFARPTVPVPKGGPEDP